MKNDIRAVIEGLGYTIPDAQVYKHINNWRDWYRGYFPAFHDYSQYNGRRRIKRQRKSLRMAKRVSEDHANLLLNERVQISIDNDRIQEAVDAALKANDFRVQGSRLVEKAYALGTGAFLEHSDGEGGVLIDYVSADMIFPTGWEGDKIIDCIFASIKTASDRKFLYLNIHKLEQGEYVIYNKMVPMDAGGAVMLQPEPGKGKKAKPRPAEQPPDAETGLLPGDIAPEVRTQSPTPRFQIIGPNQVNNIDPDSPMGIAIFANAIDVLEGIDLVYDSYCGEFRLGKKRIIIPQSMLQLMQEDDNAWLAFDDNDTEFYGLKDDNLTEIKEINMELRTEAHDQALQRFLNLLSEKCGLGNDRYDFEGGGVKTATEVISEKSELYQNRKKNELIIEAAIQDMCAAIAEIQGHKEKFEATIYFDDSIIEDSEAKRTRMQALVTQGKFPLWRFLYEYEGYSEQEAKEIAAEVETAEPPELTFEDQV